MDHNDPTPPAPRRRAAAPRKTSAKTPSFTENSAMNETTPSTSPATSPTLGGGTGHSAPDHRTEAKSRFNAAVSEAKAGAAALKAEAAQRASAYRGQAGERGKDLLSEAKAYGEDARVKGKELAAQGKGKVSEGLTALGQAVADNAHVVDEKLGAKYGDYARTASRGLQDAATRLDQKSVEELGEDARAFVRKSPAAAVGIAAVIGFLLSRLFTGSRR